MGLLGLCMLCFYKARRRMRDIEAVRSVPYTPLGDLPMLLRTMPSDEGYIVKVRHSFRSTKNISIFGHVTDSSSPASEAPGPGFCVWLLNAQLELHDLLLHPSSSRS